MMQSSVSSFSALTQLAGQHKGHPACKNVGWWFVGDNDMMFCSPPNFQKNGIYLLIYFVIKFYIEYNR